MRLVVYGDIGGSGGYVRYCKGLFGSESIPKDIEIWFFCSQSFCDQLAPLDHGVHVISHPWMTSNSRIKRYLWYLWKYPQLVRRIKPDIEFYPSGQLRVYLRKALTVSTCHNLLLFDEKELKRIEDKHEQLFFQGYRKNQTRSFLKSDAVIFLSNHSKKVVCNEIPGLNLNTVIAHGLDKIFINHEQRSYEVGKRINLLYISPIYHYKHQIEVVKAIQILRVSLKLDICISFIGVGESSAASQLNKLVEDQNIQDFIFLKGNMNYEDLLEEYSTSDLFIFASSCETFGITLLEAMGARLPIACSDRTGLSEILKDAGLYFNPEDPESIANTISKLIMNKDLRKTLGERACQYALDYTWERCASETFNYIKNIQKQK